MIEKLSEGAKVRLVIGFMAVTLGLMDLINPFISEKWKWLRDWAVSLAGPYGYAVLLFCIGAALFVWVAFEVGSKKE